jgi:hypothetical protein
LVLYRFQYRYRVFKPYVNQFHRKAFAPLNIIRALNGLPSLNNLQAQINNLSRRARVTFSVAYKLSDVRLSFSIVFKSRRRSAFTRGPRFCKLTKIAYDLKCLTSGSNRSLRSLGLAKARAAAKTECNT